MSLRPRSAFWLSTLLAPVLAACVRDQPAAPPPSPSRAAHLWRFDEPSGPVAQDATGGHPGKLGVGVTRVPGCAGNAVALQGDPSSTVDLGERAGAFGTRDFTVSLWFRTTTRKGNNELLSNRSNGSHGNFFNLRFSAAGVVVYEIDEDTSGRNYVALSSRPGLNDGAWHHAAARRQGTSATLFIDGDRAVEGHTSGVTNIANGRPLEVGSSSVAAEYDLHFKGVVDELGIFDRALGDAEIASLAASPSGCRPGSPP